MVLSALHLMTILFYSSESLSSLSSVLSLMVFLILLRDLKALVVKLTELQLISAGSRMCWRRGPKSHSCFSPLQRLCLMRPHQRQR